MRLDRAVHLLVRRARSRGLLDWPLQLVLGIKMKDVDEELLELFPPSGGRVDVTKVPKRSTIAGALCCELAQRRESY
jgi:hypothetical protein